MKNPGLKGHKSNGVSELKRVRVDDVVMRARVERRRLAIRRKDLWSVATRMKDQEQG
jgi:outer membrane phospholipase A